MWAMQEGSSMPEIQSNFETDHRFPSGEWTGFWLQKGTFDGRQKMELALTFLDGKVSGDGKDIVGPFTMRGRYDLSNGKVVIHKYYPEHHVLYEGWAELDKGIWGVWTVPGLAKDGFHLWPKGMRDPSQPMKRAEAGTDQKGREKVRLVEEAAAGGT
jgi:hypothetical protein